VSLDLTIENKIANAVDENIKKLSKELDEDIEFFSLPENLCYFHPLDYNVR
jgi:hypothetical protein